MKCKYPMTDEAHFKIKFTDRMVYDPQTKTVVSVRDGVQEYLGAELGMHPPEKFFKIYRAKETIADIVDIMPGLPVTVGHVPLIDSIPNEDITGSIIDSTLHYEDEPLTDTTVKIKNKVKLDELPDNNELSLGYFADLIPCEKYDFEQVDMVPHHLAIVRNGRCGDTCKFTDQKGGSTMKKKLSKKGIAAFLDAGGEVNMQQVLELVADLPEVVKTLNIKALAKLVPILQKAVEAAKATNVEQGGEPIPPAAGEGGEPAAEQGTEGEEPTVPAEIEDGEGGEPVKKVETTDAVSVTDSTEFKDAVAAGIAVAVKSNNAEYSSVMIKARDFLDKAYDFTDKSAQDIMRDALATQHTEKFADGELSTAFKLLKKTIDYSKFGDEKKGSLTDLADKEI